MFQGVRTKLIRQMRAQASDADQAPQKLTAQLQELRDRISRLEQDQLSKDDLSETLRDLAKKVVGDRPNMNFFNERFRDYELALANIKQLGYYMGQRLYEERMPRRVNGPKSFPLTSKGCTQSDMESEWFAFWCDEMRTAAYYHRKLWEFCYIAQVLHNEGKLSEESHGLGFGCGEEPLPSLFAKYGARVLATDLDTDRPETQGWRATNQHAGVVETVRRRDICPDEDRLNKIEFRPADMNAIPNDLDGKFDFCWSACSLEHLGSIDNGLSFIENSLRSLRPGGVAVHTTEWNTGDGETIDHWGTVLFQKYHFQEVAERLRRKGYWVSEPDFDLGSGVMDRLVDLPPWQSSVLRQSAHLKLSVDGFVCTSFGLIIKVPR